jgi:hypothetical protein
VLHADDPHAATLPTSGPAAGPGLLIAGVHRRPEDQAQHGKGGDAEHPGGPQA